ncbi:nucleoside hydrolase [Desulfonatronum thioautotrophicum]|uniref:nucleoside hydrolase n=1 Tax=Desulfonatronum thioautotrophicum TaxID=617001 RepID=UPI0005EBBD88|nr:nucleoside hydrolase [Desulfonatronum thioautotrophicum]
MFPNSHQVIRPGEPIIFIGGGTIEDYTAAALLFTMEDIDYRGNITTNADCIYNFAMQNQWKLQAYLGVPDYPITLSEARAWNPFPMEYRKDSIKVHQLPLLDEHPENPDWPSGYVHGETFLKDQLHAAIADKVPLTLLITNPLTPLTTVLQKDPELAQGIKRVIWMGGAVHAPGNLDPDTIPAEIANPKAEWNVFWDPYAVDWIFQETDLSIILCPLDVTSQAKLTPRFLSMLQSQGQESRYSRIVHSLYSLVEGQPFFEMWNSLAAVYLAKPDLFDPPVSMTFRVETEGFMQGALVQDPEGRRLDVVLNIKDKDAFYEYVLNRLKQN